MTDIEPGTRWAEQQTKELLERRDAERQRVLLWESRHRDDEERYGTSDPYFEEDGIVEVVATSTPEHDCQYHWIEICAVCGAQPSYYRRSERVNVKDELL